jgi:hypothetical protein
VEPPQSVGKEGAGMTFGKLSGAFLALAVLAFVCVLFLDPG